MKQTMTEAELEEFVAGLHEKAEMYRNVADALSEIRAIAGKSIDNPDSRRIWEICSDAMEGVHQGMKVNEFSKEGAQ